MEGGFPLVLEMFADTVIKCEVFKLPLAERIGSWVPFWQNPCHLKHDGKEMCPPHPSPKALGPW